jgi:hypothetical protein
MNCFMSTAPYERIDKWAHEPRPNFNDKKQLSNTIAIINMFYIN